MAKGKIACFEQFLLLSQCIKKLFAQDASTSGKGLNWFSLTDTKGRVLYYFLKILFDMSRLTLVASCKTAVATFCNKTNFKTVLHKAV